MKAVGILDISEEDLERMEGGWIKSEKEVGKTV